jgi:adenylosuccinate synthase
VLLDEWRGFHPYTTWSTCTFDNALDLLCEHGALGAGADHELTRLGVLRTYATRHGPGPMPTEAPDEGPWPIEPHNGHGPWQGAFRRGWLDLVLARYAIEVCGGVDGLALTHLDALPRLPRWRACTRYRVRGLDERLFVHAGAASDEVVAVRPGAPRDLEHAGDLARALGRVTPLYEEMGAASCVRRIEEVLGTEVLVRSSGPRAADKELVGRLGDAGAKK